MSEIQDFRADGQREARKAEVLTGAARRLS